MSPHTLPPSKFCCAARLAVSLRAPRATPNVAPTGVETAPSPHRGRAPAAPLDACLDRCTRRNNAVGASRKVLRRPTAGANHPRRATQPIMRLVSPAKGQWHWAGPAPPSLVLEPFAARSPRRRCRRLCPLLTPAEPLSPRGDAGRRGVWSRAISELPVWTPLSTARPSVRNSLHRLPVDTLRMRRLLPARTLVGCAE
jgi:hypothetical protein